MNGVHSNIGGGLKTDGLVRRGKGSAIGGYNADLDPSVITRLKKVPSYRPENVLQSWPATAISRSSGRCRPT